MNVKPGDKQMNLVDGRVEFLVNGHLIGSIDEHKDAEITELGKQMGYHRDLLVYLVENPGKTEWDYERGLVC